MKKFVFSLLAVVACVFVACAANDKKNEKETGTAASASVLVAFFSAEGHTKALAEKIAKETGGTLFQIEPEVPYTKADLDGWDDNSRATLEARDRSRRPAIANRVEDFAKYDTVYLGFPIWWYTAPTIINTFLESYDTAGKVIIPFATSGGSAFGNTEKDLKVSAPKAMFKPGKVLNAATQKQVSDWINSIK